MMTSSSSVEDLLQGKLDLPQRLGRGYPVDGAQGADHRCDHGEVLNGELEHGIRVVAGGELMTQ